MANSLSDIQDRINKRADQKLEDVIRQMHKGLYDGEPYKLLSGINVDVGTAEKPKIIPLCSIFTDGGVIKKLIIENNQDRYRDTESKQFIDQVNSLRSDVDHLLDSI